MVDAMTCKDVMLGENVMCSFMLGQQIELWLCVEIKIWVPYAWQSYFDKDIASRLLCWLLCVVIRSSCETFLHQTDMLNMLGDVMEQLVGPMLEQDM